MLSAFLTVGSSPKRGAVGSADPLLGLRLLKFSEKAADFEEREVWLALLFILTSRRP